MMSTGVPVLPSRPASAPLNRRFSATDCRRVVKPLSAVGEAAGVAGSGRSATTTTTTSPAAELDVSYSRDEVEVCREMVLVSLIEGAVRSSGVRAVLYKCHMCGGFVSSLGGLTRHMATHGSATPPPPPPPPSTSDPQLDDAQRHRRKNAPGSSSPSTCSPASGLATSADRCNGHADSGHVVDHDDADDPADRSAADAEAVVASSAAVDCSQQQAEDLSKPTSLRRQHRSVSSRRRGTVTEPLQCRRPSQRLAYVSSEMLASNQMSSDLGSGQLANEIRAKEHLDDDVTVVIPSDAPLDFVARADTLRVETPTTWSPSPCSEEGGKCTEEIAHAPVKSIMGHPHVHRKARLSGSSMTTTAALSTADGGSTSSVGSGSTLKSDANLTAAHQQMSLLNVSAAAADSFQLGGLPAVFGPLALSTFVHGFGGLVAAASPFLSYYTHMPTAASLASLMSVTSSPLSSPPAATNSSAVDCSKLSEQHEDKSDDSPTDGASMQVEEASSNGSGSSGWTSDPLSAGLTNPATKCSSLSRTHSRSVL